LKRLRQDFTRIRLDRQKISPIAEEAEEGRASFQKATCATISGQHEVITQTLFEHHDHFDQGFDQLEEKWVQQLGLAQFYQALAFEKSVSKPTSRPPKTVGKDKMSSEDPEAQSLTLLPDHQQKSLFPGISVQALQYNGPICKPWCPCICHSRVKIQTPKILDRVVSRLFVGYTDLHYASNQCNK
jgi:hypothetical protein